MENNNINTNVAQIIFPKDMELRKIKKKKKKSSSEKKKVLNDLKETLKSYDTALSVAGSKKINIPAEIGILPDNITQINSIKELKELTATLQARIQIINQLVMKGVNNERVTGLFNEGLGSGQRLPSTPGVFPQRMPMTPGVFPQSIPATPQQQIFQNPIFPSPPMTPQVQDNDASQSLDQLRQEILNQLSPEDRAEAEAQLEQQEQQASRYEKLPASPDSPGDPYRNPEPLSPDRLINDLNLETDLGYPTLQGRMDIIAPQGFTDIYDEYRQYLEGITQKLVKMDDGVFELPALAEQSLNTTRQDILNQHDQWIKSLNDKQRQYIDNDSNLRQLNQDIIKNTSIDAIDIIKQIAIMKNIKINQITSGETKTEEKLKTDRSEPAKKLITEMEVSENQNSTKIEDVNKSKKFKNLAEIRQQVKEIQDDVNQKRQSYNSLSGLEKASIEMEYQDFIKKMTNLNVAMQRLINEDNIELDPEGNVIQFISAPISQSADVANSPPQDSISDLPSATQQQIRILIGYINRQGNINDTEKNAFRELFIDNPEKMRNFAILQGKPKKEKRIKRELKEKFPFLKDSDFESVASS